MTKLSRLQTVLLIIGLVVIWGLCWPIYKIALNYTPPILFSGARTLLGGIIMLAVIAPTYKKIRLKQTWHIYLISAIFNAFLFFGLQTIGLNYLPEGLFTVLVYLQPVLVGVLAWLWLGEAMTVRKLFGFLMGFAGVGIISVDSLSGHLSAVGIGLALASAVSWAIGTVYVKRVSAKVDALWLIVFQCIIAGVLLTAIGSGMESWSSIVWNASYLVGLLYGAIFGIPLSWVMFYALIRSGEAGKVSSFTFLVPLIAVALGAIFLHESLKVYFLIGFVLILGSIYIVNQSSGGRRRKDFVPKDFEGPKNTLPAMEQRG